ncbi:MAG: STAS domain-containing protein [Cytophagales bacterium]|nr:STAS domain-containing protein [Bernardetiaceae bacterium]MDW8205237.1 STAS domain-containing protein [Cytophagales bacterium]
MVEVKTKVENRVTVVSVHGELDASSALILDNALEGVIAQKPAAVVVDCSALEYISSPGIGVFISRHGECEEKQISFALCNVSQKINNVFKILGLDQVVKIYATTDEATTAMGASY